MKKGLIGWMILLLPLFVTAQVSFEATTDARQVVVNNYVDITFTLRNADGDDFNPPSFENFSVLSGPARSLSTTIVNGKVSKEFSYVYTLQPRRKGKFTIGSASIRVAGKLFRTKPIQIEVIENKALGKINTANQVFVRAELNIKNAFIGQQITLDYKLYTAMDIDSYSILEESEYQGFYAQDLRRFDDPPVREVIRGVRYVTKILKRVALFPQQAGLLDIAPLKLEMAVLKEDPRQEGFLLNRPVQRIFLQSEPVNVNVKPLPNNAAPFFSGAVGNYIATYALNRTDVSTDDVLSLRLSISGNGDIKRVQPPKLELPDSFEVYDPKILEETTSESLNGELIGKKEIEYIILPKKAGKYRLQPSFSYFNPESGKYATINQNAFNITVQQGVRRATEPVADEISTSVISDDIRFIKSATYLQQSNDYFFGSPIFWTLAALPFLFFGGIILLKRNQTQQSNIDTAQLRIKRARQEAQNRLKVAEQHLKVNQSRAFYNEISKSLLGYVCDKLQIAGSTLTKDNVREKLHSLNVEETLINDFMEIIQTSEIALYSGKDNPTAMNDIYQKAVSNLSIMEESLEAVRGSLASGIS